MRRSQKRRDQGVTRPQRFEQSLKSLILLVDEKVERERGVAKPQFTRRDGGRPNKDCVRSRSPCPPGRRTAGKGGAGSRSVLT